MKKSELLARIQELEARIRELEMRPQYPVYIQPGPMYSPYPWVPTWTCDVQPQPLMPTITCQS